MAQTVYYWSGSRYKEYCIEKETAMTYKLVQTFPETKWPNSYRLNKHKVDKFFIIGGGFTMNQAQIGIWVVNSVQSAMDSLKGLEEQSTIARERIEANAAA